jgi:hypothetical protein
MELQQVFAEAWIPKNQRFSTNEVGGRGAIQWLTRPFRD